MRKPLPGFLAVLLLVMARPLGAAPEASKSPVLVALEETVGRSIEILKQKGDPPPYFIGYRVTESDDRQLSATRGALRRNNANRSRAVDVDVRVGSYDLDNTRRVRGGGREYDLDRFRRTALPIEDDVVALKAGLWLETERKYRAAAEWLPLVKADVAVKAAAEDASADFAEEPPDKLIAPLPGTVGDLASWEARLRSISALFKDEPSILESEASLSVSSTKKFFASSEGASVQHGSVIWRVALYATARADDGMDLYLFESFAAHASSGLPDDVALAKVAAKMKANLVALRKAPALEPFTGPAILSGKAAGVFFHEIFGHRVEGHRQKDEGEGQTFTKMVGQKVLPDFLSVYDDPTMSSSAGVDLNGAYAADDEGVRSRRVTVVENGVLKGFLMSRSPVAGFASSNGHGRAQVGMRPVARQGNLIIEAAKTVPEKDLRELLVAECRRQGKPFGLYFADISGGFTFTGRVIPQAYTVMPLIVYRIYADGRPDELVRGADLIGTPLISFSKILAAGANRAVFNGTCGAESGWVPVAASSPSILTAQIEVQKKAKGSSRPPVLPPPGKGVQP